MKQSKKYPEGHFLGIGIALGLAFGIPFGVALDNIALGLPLGLPIGIAIGISLESKYKKQGLIRPLTKKEKLVSKIALVLGLALFIIGISIFMLLK